MSPDPSEGPPPKARLAIVDDHPVVREGLRQILAAEPDLEVCGEAPGGRAALRLLQEQPFDLVLVDLSLADTSGLDLIKQIRALGLPVKILVCSMHDEALFAERVIVAGGHGYVMKQEAPGRILEAIRKVLRGGIYLSDQMADALLIPGPGRGPAPGGASPLARLSDRELEVFQLIGRGLGTSRIADTLGLGIKTVETHRGNIKKKLGLQTNEQLVRRALEWALEAPE
jgi:DNA-binding NarL/FixJ family response regulator